MTFVGSTAARKALSPSITIVVADDVQALALSRAPTTEGYAVENVARGDEGLQKLANAHPDLAIREWVLPGVSGPEICARLRAEDATRTMPIILLSSRGEESLRLRGFSAAG